MNSFKINTRTVICVGDIHGALNEIGGLLKRYNFKDTSLIFCGDVGFGFYKPEYYKQIFNKLKKECKKRNCYCFFIRGNHDDPSYFNGKDYKKGYIITVPDYTILQFYDMEDSDKMGFDTCVLCVGGATSVDRTYRKAVQDIRVRDYMRWHFGVPLEEAKKNVPQSYWEDEKPIFDIDKLNEIIESGVQIDVVCSHTCPSFCEPVTKDGITSWLNADETLSNDIDEERKCMDSIYEFLKNNNQKISRWIYGHYHYHASQEIEGVRYVLLDMVRNNNFDIIQIK